MINSCTRNKKRAEAATPGPLHPLPHYRMGVRAFKLGRGGGELTIRLYGFETLYGVELAIPLRRRDLPTGIAQMLDNL